MNLVMRRTAPGGFPWLLAHEVRMSVRARRRGKRSMAVGLVLLLLYTGLGILFALGLRGVAIVPIPMMLTAVLAAAIVIMSFMTTQAMLGSQRTLYEAGDLDLLLTAPIPPRTVLLAKLAGIAASVVISFALLVLPLTLPIALMGHPGLLGIPALVAALALVSACLGLGFMLAVAAIAGPRAARTVGQITAAVLGGAVFLISQLISNDPGRRGSGGQALFRWFSDHHVGTGGLSALPGRAAFGDPVAIALLLGIGLAVFAATGRIFGRAFLNSYQSAGMRLARRPAAAKSRRSIARHFRSGLFATMFAKEWRLLARDPALAFQIVLRLIYLAPLVILGIGSRGGAMIAPSLAFFSVFIAGQVVGSLAWLTISAEDSPDLLVVAPVTRKQVERVKLASALAMAAPLAVVPSLVIATMTPIGAVVTLAFTAAGGAIAGLIELKWQKPMPRKTFGRRRSGSIVASLLTVLATALFGGGAAVSVWMLV
ncbi:MAG TPA: hypothetical protein VIT38_06415 [Allosphingosinicella sp.]